MPLDNTPLPDRFPSFLGGLFKSRSITSTQIRVFRSVRQRQP